MRSVIGLALWIGTLAAPTPYVFQRWQITKSWLDLALCGLLLLLCIRYIVSAFRTVGIRAIPAIALAWAPFSLGLRLLFHWLGSPERLSQTWIIWGVLGTILLNAVFEAPLEPARRELVPGETPEISLRRVLPNARGKKVSLLREAHVSTAIVNMIREYLTSHGCEVISGPGEHIDSFLWLGQVDHRVVFKIGSDLNSATQLQIASQTWRLTRSISYSADVRGVNRDLAIQGVYHLCVFMSDNTGPDPSQ